MAASTRYATPRLHRERKSCTALHPVGPAARWPRNRPFIAAWRSWAWDAAGSTPVECSLTRGAGAQPDARRVGGGRGRASPPPTASFEAPVAEALVVETARVSSSCWRSSSAAAMWGALEIKVFNQEGRPRKVHVRIYLSINPATNLTTVSCAPPRKKTVVKFVAGLTERYKKTRAFDVQPS